MSWSVKIRGTLQRIGAVEDRGGPGAEGDENERRRRRATTSARHDALIGLQSRRGRVAALPDETGAESFRRKGRIAGRGGAERGRETEFEGGVGFHGALQSLRRRLRRRRASKSRNLTVPAGTRSSRAVSATSSPSK